MGQPVTDPALLAQLNTPATIAPNPMFSGQMQGQTLGNTKTSLDIQQTAATMAAKEAEAKAQAQSAEIAARTAQEQWAINHPPATGAEGMSGPAYLKYLQQTNPGRAAYIQGLSEGRVPFPSAMMMRTPSGQALLTQVMRADPTIDATNYTTRAAARKLAATGKLSQSDNALVTAIGHAARLSSLVPDVFGGDATPLNAVGNFLDSHFFGGQQPAYDQNAELLGNEIAAAYGANSQGKQNEAGSQFSSSLTTKQKNENILGAIDLMASKLAANRAQFAYGNGQLGKPDFTLLPPQTQQELMQIPGGPQIAQKYFSGIPVMGANGAPPAPPTGPITPPPVGGPPPGLGPSNDGFNNTPDPQGAALWENAARSGLSYGQALASVAQANKQRGLNIVTPPSSNDYDKAAQYMAAHPGVDYHPFTGVTRTPLNGTAAVANDVAQSTPGAFLGHASNLVAGGIPQLLAGDSGALYDAVSRAQHPVASTLGDIAGAVGGSIGAGKALGAVTPLAGGTAATLGDLLYGTGTGAASNPDHPILGGTLGALSAGIGNVGGRFILGPALAKVGDTSLGQAIVNRFNPSFAPPAPLDAGSGMVVGQANKGIDGIMDNMTAARDLNMPYTLADADPRLRALAGSAVRKSPDMLALAESNIGPRSQGQAERAIGLINNNLAPVGDVPTLQSQILKNAQAQSAPLYAAAKAQPPPELTANPALNEVLNRPAAQTAIRQGYNTALNNGEDVGSLTYATDPNGNPVQYGNPSWNVIHYARQALDANGDTAVRQALDKQIAGLNPGFKTADAAYSGVMKGADALQAGANATGIRVTPEATQNAIASFPNNLPQFQQGYASNLADMIEQQRLTGNPYNLVNGSMGQQAKLGMVFPDGASDFSRGQALEGDMSKTGTELLGGSPTAARTAADKAFDNADIALDLGVSAATGVPPAGLLMTGLRKFSNGALDNWRLGVGTAKANQIGPLLLNTDPNANLLTLGDLLRANAARQAYVGQARNIGAAVGAPTLFGLTQQ